MEFNQKYIRNIGNLLRPFAVIPIILTANSALANELPNATTLKINDPGECGTIPDHISPVIDPVVAPQNFTTAGAIGVILGSALIEEGVDFITDRLSESAMKKTRTVAATKNLLTRDTQSPFPKVCLSFSHGEDIQLLIDLHGTKNAKGQTAYIVPTLRTLKYGKTIDNKKNKTRGLMIQLEVQSALSNTVNTQTLELGNVKPSDLVYGAGGDAVPAPGLQREFRVMPNPFQSFDGSKVEINIPVVFTVSLTEVRDANKALQFLADTAETSNDDLTRAVIEIVVPQDNNGG